MKAIQKSPGTKKKVAEKPARGKTSGEKTADGPDKRRPETKADEIYGDTKIPESHRKG